MLAIQPEKLSPGEARRLSSFLRSTNAPVGTLNLNQLKGFLFCISCSPDLLQPSFWLPEVFGGEMPVFEQEADFWFIEAVLRLYNQITAEVLERNPKLPASCRLDRVIRNNFQSGNGLHDWCSGFEMGLTLTIHYWDEFPLQEMGLEEEIAAYWGILTFFADEQRATAMSQASDTTPPLPGLAKIMRDQLPWVIKDYADIGRTLYETGMEEDGQLPPQDGESRFDDLFDDKRGGSGTQAASNVLAPFDNTDDLPPADALMEIALQSDDPLEKVELAHQALELNSQCIDALLLLADWAARSDSKYITYLERAVAAGEAELGEQYFKDNTGYFWGLWETRPYMTALCQLAGAYKEAKRYAESIVLFEKGLRLNPNDNQALRYVLLSLYLLQHQHEKADALITEYDEDSAFILYSRALLCFIREGDSPGARQLKKAALASNKHVSKLLSGRTKIPKQLPDFYSPGDKNEAIFYALDNKPVWRQVMGALAWLLKR